MINKYTPAEGTCPFCHSVLLEHVGTQAHCRDCLQFVPALTQEVRFVPEQYESNCKNKNQLEKERKYNNLIRQFSEKYWQIREKEELQLLRVKLSQIKSLSIGKKGSRQAAALVVYFHMKDQIKMNIKQYCKDNNLSVKLFHQKYKIYRNLNNPQGNHYDNEPEFFLKEEELNKIEESPTEKESIFNSDDDEEPELVVQKQEEEGLSFTERARHAILLIYDHVFNKFFFKQKKQMIIKGLISKFQDISHHTLKAIGYQLSPPIKTYYLIFAVIKSLGYRINFIEYANVVKEHTKFMLKRKPASEIKKTYQQHQTDQDEPGVVKLEENVSKGEEKSRKRSRRKGKREDSKERVDLSDSELNSQGKR